MEAALSALVGLLTVTGTLLTVVVTLQKIGLMAGRERKPHLTRTLEKVSAGMDALIERVEVVDTRVDLNHLDIKILRGQHGEPAPEGEYESWKLTPKLKEQIGRAADASMVNAKMLNALSLAAKSAPEDSKKRAEAGWALNDGMEEYKLLKRDAG